MSETGRLTTSPRRFERFRVMHPRKFFIGKHEHILKNEHIYEMKSFDYKKIRNQ